MTLKEAEEAVAEGSQTQQSQKLKLRLRVDKDEYAELARYHEQERDQDPEHEQEHDPDRDWDRDAGGGQGDLYSQLLEVVSDRGVAGEYEDGGGAGGFASPVEGALVAEGKRRSRGKKTQVRGRDGSKQKAFGDKDSSTGERTFWLHMEDYFRPVTPQDVRLLRPPTYLGLTPQGHVRDPCLAVPPLGGHYAESWAREDGAEADRASEALAQQSVTRVKRKILAASPVSKKRKVSSSADNKVMTTVISPPENDDDELCHVCYGGDSDHSNQILFCDSCDVAAHQDCYGIRVVPEGEWICTWCSFKNKHPRRTVSHRKSSATDAWHADVPSVQTGPPDCVLCPVRGGALKPVAEADSNGSTRGSGKPRFAHLFCCQWVPETYIQSMEAMEPIKNVEGVREERWKLLCAICKEKHGACIQCSHGFCATAFHPLCARDARFRMEVSSREDSEDVDLRAFCQKHSSTRGGRTNPSGGESNELGEGILEGQPEGVEAKDLPLPVPGVAYEGEICRLNRDVHGVSTTKGYSEVLDAASDSPPAAGKSIAKLLVARAVDEKDQKVLVPELARVERVAEQADPNHDSSSSGKVALTRELCHTSKQADIDETDNSVNGVENVLSGLQEGRMSEYQADAAETVDSRGREVDVSSKNPQTGSGSKACLLDKPASEPTAVIGIADSGDDVYDLSLDEERRQRGLRGDASTSRATVQERRASLNESQGKNLHMAGIGEEDQTSMSEFVVPERSSDSDKAVASEERAEGGLLESGNGGQVCEGNDLDMDRSRNSSGTVGMSVTTLQLDTAGAEAGVFAAAGAKVDSAQETAMLRPAISVPQGSSDVNSGISEPVSKSCSKGGTMVESGFENSNETSAISVSRKGFEKRPHNDQPRLRFKIVSDATGRVVRCQQDVGSDGGGSPLEEKQAQMCLRPLDSGSSYDLKSECPEEVSQSCPHPFLLKKLENLQRSYDIGRKDEKQGATEECSLAQKCDVLGVLSPEDSKDGLQTKPGNGILVDTQPDDGDMNSWNSQWKQLKQAKQLGLLDLAPEDEIVGEILLLQDKLVDCTHSNRARCNTLISRLLHILPDERQTEQKHSQELALVKHFQAQAKEAKKQGRKEKRDKEAQAILAAATAAAAASPRVSYMRRDTPGASLQEEPMTQASDAGLEPGFSQSLVPAAIGGGAFQLSRATKPPVPRPPKLVLSAGRPAGSSRSGLHVKGTTSKISVAKVGKSGLYRENAGCFEDETPLCNICGIGELRANKLVSCERCKVVVHQECYGVGRVPLGAWLCQPCSEMQRSFHNMKPVMDNTGKLGPGVQCAVCPARTGAFKRTSDGRWAHVFCAQWLPETTAGKDQAAPIEGLETVLLDRYGLLCSICRRQQGACLTCNFGHCHGAFHPSCARDYGLYMNVKSSSGGRVQYRAYCERHSPQQRAKAELKQRGGSDEMQVLKQIRVDFEKVRLICERILRREKVKRDLLHTLKDIGINQLRVATLTDSIQGQTDQFPDGYSAHGPPNKAHRGADEKLWTDGSLPPTMPRLANDKAVPSASRTTQPEDRRKHKRQKEPLHREKLMTPIEASMQNLRLPKGYAYVPVDTVPVPHQTTPDKQTPPGSSK